MYNIKFNQLWPRSHVSSVLVRYSAKYNHVLLFKLFFGFINIQSKKKKNFLEEKNMTSKA